MTYKELYQQYVQAGEACSYIEGALECMNVCEHSEVARQTPLGNRYHHLVEAWVILAFMTDQAARNESAYGQVIYT